MARAAFKGKILSTSMLVAPALAVISISNPALANCSVTAGGGTVGNPNNGSTITCVVAGGDHGTTVGAGTDGVGATVDVQAGATIDVNGDHAIELDTATITLGNGATVRAHDADNVRAFHSQSVNNAVSVDLTLGDNAQFMTETANKLNSMNATNLISTNNSATAMLTLSGANSKISTEGRYSHILSASGGTLSAATVVLSGDNAELSTADAYSDAIYQRSNNGDVDITLTLSGDTAKVTTAGDYAEIVNLFTTNGNTDATITLSGDNSELYTQGEYAVALRFESDNADTDVTVELSGDNSLIDTEGKYSVGVYILGDTDTDAVITLSGASAKIDTAGEYADGIFVSGQTTATATITLSNTSTEVYTQNDYAVGAYIYSNNSNTDATVTLSGDNSKIETAGYKSYGIYAKARFDDADLDVTLSGDTAKVVSQGNNAAAIRAGGIDAAGTAIATVTLSGDNSQVNAQGNNSDAVYAYSFAGTAKAVVTLSGSNTSIISTQEIGVHVSGAGGTNPTSSIDSAGLIQGGTYSIMLDDGDDTLTLRTGSNLSSPSGANLGAGTDTLTLVGTATENEVFLNVETVDVNGTDWTLSGTSTFDDINVNTGIFTNGGTLTVNNNVDIANGATFTGAGTLNGNVDVRLGGTWKGTGTIVGTVTNDGTVAPGNSVGTQTITGNFVQNAGGTLDIEFDNGGIDFLDISGTANIAGTLRLIELAPGVTQNTPLTFLEADGGITGSFSPVTEVFLMGTDLGQATVDIGATSATVTFAAFTANYEGQGQNASERAVGRAVDVSSLSDPAGSLGVINALEATPDVSATLSSLSGVITSGTVGAAQAAITKVNNIVRGRLTADDNSNRDPTTGLSSGNQLASFLTRPKTVWAQGIGGIGKIEGDSSNRGVDYESYGTAAGMEVDIDEYDAKTGVFAAVTDSETHVQGLRDEGNVRSLQAGFYGAKSLNQRTHINGSLSAGWHDLETKRPGNTGTARANFEGYSAHGYGEVLYNAKLHKKLLYTPYLGIQGDAFYREAYRENGGSLFNQSVDNELTLKLASELGLQVRGILKNRDWLIYPLLRLGWSHEFLDQSSEISSHFSNLPAARFKATGPEASRDAAKIGAELSIEDHSGGSAFYTSYDGKISADAQDHQITAGFKFRW